MVLSVQGPPPMKHWMILNTTTCAFMPSHFSTLIRSACYQIAVASNSFDLSQATVSIHFYLYCDERTVEFILLYTVIEFQLKKRIQNDAEICFWGFAIDTSADGTWPFGHLDSFFCLDCFPGPFTWRDSWEHRQGKTARRFSSHGQGVGWREYSTKFHGFTYIHT